MRTLFLTSAAVLAIAGGATTASGQAAPEGDTSAPSTVAPATPAMTSQQKMTYDAWPADKKAQYDAWPAEYQAYFWSLTANQQAGWFALTDAQRKQIYEMPPASRAQAWVSIEQQLAASAPPSAAMTPAPDPAMTPGEDNAAAAPGQVQVQANPVGSSQATDPSPDPATASSPVAPAIPADPSYKAGPYKGALTAPPAEAMNKTYPVCTKTLQDSCRNPGGI